MSKNLEIASALTSYVEENKFDLLGKAIVQTSLGSTMTLRAGIQGNKARITLIDTDLQVSTAGCGWNPGGTVSLTAVDVTMAHLQVQKAFCIDEFRQSWVSTQLQPSAMTGVEGPMPAEALFTQNIVESMANFNESFIINGHGSVTGLQAQLAAASDFIAGPDEDLTWISGPVGTASGVINAVDAVLGYFEKLPHQLIGKTTYLVVNPDSFRTLLTAMVKSNLYHYTPEDNMEYLTVPGTNIRVIATSGIASDSNFKFCTSADNMILATDLLNDMEELRWFYSESDIEYRLFAKWSIGVVIPQTDLVVAANAS